MLHFFLQITAFYAIIKPTNERTIFLMKKFISLILAILLAFSAVGCVGGGEVTTAADNPTEAPAPDTSPATEPAPETTEEIKEDKMLNILFLGNSLMYYNDMPDLFAKIAQANGKKVNVQSVTKGSATISDFTDERTEVGKHAALQLDFGGNTELFKLFLCPDADLTAESRRAVDGEHFFEYV